MKQQNETDMAYWRRQYEENYEAAWCAQLDAYAITAKHAFIIKRMEQMAQALEQVKKIGGSEAVVTLLSGKDGTGDAFTTQG